MSNTINNYGLKTWAYYIFKKRNDCAPKPELNEELFLFCVLKHNVSRSMRPSRIGSIRCASVLNAYFTQPASCATQRGRGRLAKCCWRNMYSPPQANSARDSAKNAMRRYLLVTYVPDEPSFQLYSKTRRLPRRELGVDIPSRSWDTRTLEKFHEYLTYLRGTWLFPMLYLVRQPLGATV